MILLQTSITSGITNYLTTSIVDAFITPGNLAQAGLAVGGAGTLISPVFKGTGRTFIGFAILLLIGSVAALYFGF